jgi:hypothetical protein
VPAGRRGGFDGLLANLRSVIQESRQQALRTVDVIQVRTCWLVGRHIVEFEQGGASRAAYGRGLLTEVSARLTAEFGRGFDASNLRYMRLFYQAFPNCDALRHELSWTHYRLLLRVEDAATRTWYMNEAADQNWNTRALDRQIGRVVFYNYLLKCFVLFDLKTEALTHQDIGQMDMYVRLYDDQRRGPGDGPTVGIILCAHKDHTVVRYSVLHGHEQLFASKYRLVLPSEEELRAELIREQELLGERLALQQHASPRKASSKAGRPKKGGAS